MVACQLSCAWDVLCVCDYPAERQISCGDGSEPRGRGYPVTGQRRRRARRPLLLVGETVRTGAAAADASDYPAH